MSKAKTTRQKPLASAATGSESGRVTRALKWVATATAILSLVFSIRQLVNLVADWRDRIAQVAALEKTAALQQSESNYAAAWESLLRAHQLAESGGQLFRLLGRQAPELRQITAMQEDLGMTWLQNVHLTGDQKFGEVVDKVEPVLQTGVTSASGSRKADLLAHIGWGIFLRDRDGGPGVDPERLYREAVATDANNPYALAYWGHWELWNGIDHLASAQQHFQAALASGRERSYVRQIQLAALEGRSNSDEKLGAEFLRQLNDMRANGEPIDVTARSDAYAMYYFAVAPGNQASVLKLLSAVPPAEQIKTFQALFFTPDFDPAKIPNRQKFLALLQRAAGECAESQKTLAALGPQVDPGYKSLLARIGADFGCVSAQR